MAETVKNLESVNTVKGFYEYCASLDTPFKGSIKDGCMYHSESGDGTAEKVALGVLHAIDIIQGTTGTPERFFTYLDRMAVTSDDVRVNVQAYFNKNLSSVDIYLFWFDGREDASEDPKDERNISHLKLRLRDGKFPILKTWKWWE